MFTSKTVVDETLSTNVRKSIVGIDASEFYPYSLYQLMATGCYTRYEFDANLQRFKPHQNNTRTFENMLKACFQ